MPRAGKRLIVACDGTWVSSDNGFVKDSWMPWSTSGRLATPSNVTKICRALLPRSTDGKDAPQVVYYQGGLGSQSNWYSFFIGGYLGAGIDENIREAYAFLCNNYEAGDEIFLIGFSRGAFTARSVGGLIASIGLLTKEGLKAFYPIFRDWENQATPGYKSAYDSSVWPLATRPPFPDPAYLQGLVRGDLTRPNIPIKAVAVWDTVGALGVPNIKILGIPVYTAARREYSFVNTQVASNVENAYQALALDECRDPFVPTVWEAPAASSPSSLKELRQCWFPGVHSSIGGGYSDSSISDLTLAWMITRLSPHLSFNTAYVPALQAANVAFYASRSPPISPPRPWAMGLLKRSDLGLLNTLTGRSIRTPGAYYATSATTDKTTQRKLRGTEETIHPSVRYRRTHGGAGLAKTEGDYRGEGAYDPAALTGWSFAPAGTDLPIKGTQDWDMETNDDGGRWHGRSADGTTVVLEEEKLVPGTPEWDLLSAWGEVVVAEVVEGN